MKYRITDHCKTASELSESVRQHLSRFAIATILAGAGLLALAWPADAEIVYTHANITIGANSTYNLDLNNDGIPDFTISTYYRYTHCVFDRGDLVTEYVNETPGPGNGSEEGSPSPARLIMGDQIGPSQTYDGGGRMAYYEYHQCPGGSGSSHSGNWYEKSGYLGLMFQINGEVYYGWAQLHVGVGGNVGAATLLGYAYENTPGMPINAGQMPPNFKIAASPTSATVSPGQSTTSTLTLTPLFGFSGTVALTCKVPSADGLSCEASPTSVTLDGTNSVTATLSINTSSSTPAGTYKINAKGTYGAISHGTTFTLTVQ